MRLLNLFIIFICGAHSLFGNHDVLTLTNGMIFSGDVISIKNCKIKFRAENGNKYTIPYTDIRNIVFHDKGDKLYVKYTDSTDADNCLKGRLDADNYHGKGGVHVALGVLFGPFAIIGAAVSTPSPSKGNETLQMSKNKKLFSDPNYLNCYTKKAKEKNVTNTALGWGAWILFILLL